MIIQNEGTIKKNKKQHGPQLKADKHNQKLQF